MKVFVFLLATILSISTAFAGTINVSLSPDRWKIRYSQNMPSRPSLEPTGGWYFNFPKGTNCSDKYNCPGVHYVTNTFFKVIPKGATLNIKLKIVADPTTVFNYQLEKSNTCISPAAVRAFLQKINDNMIASNGRFWSNPGKVTLANGIFTLSVPLVSDQWTNVDGQHSVTGFAKILNNMGNIGITFGGGCFFGHGVNVSGGTAKFIMTGFSITY